MIGLPQVYVVGGAFFAAAAWFAARTGSGSARWRSAAFWGLLAVCFLFGDALGDLGNGLLVIALVALASFGLGAPAAPELSPDARRASAEKHGDALFAIALVIPFTALAGTLAVKHFPALAQVIDPKQATLVSLITGVLLALAIALVRLRAPLAAPLREGQRLLSAVGWAAILPQMLAALGAVFLSAGVGKQVGALLAAHLPLGTPLAAVAVYCCGMALFTALMGNAFAAFPVMTAAIGLPIVVHRFGGDPAAVCAIGMLSGFCGTLLTPMAANFNVVPANLLELPGARATFNPVIRTQAPTALLLLAVNVLLMRVLAFH